MHLFNSTVCIYTHYEKPISIIHYVKFVSSTIFHSHVVNVDACLKENILANQAVAIEDLLQCFQLQQRPLSLP